MFYEPRYKKICLLGSVSLTRLKKQQKSRSDRNDPKFLDRLVLANSADPD